MDVPLNPLIQDFCFFVSLPSDFNKTIIQWGVKTFTYHSNTSLAIAFSNTNYVIFTTSWVDTFEAVTIMPLTKTTTTFYTAQGRGNGNSTTNKGSWIAIGAA